MQVFPRQIRQKVPVNKKSIFGWYVFCASNLLTLGWLCQSIHRVEADLLDPSTGQAHNPESCSEHGEARLHGPGYPFLPTPPPQSDGFPVESNVRDGINGCDRWPALDTCQDNLKIGFTLVVLVWVLYLKIPLICGTSALSFQRIISVN